MKETKRKGERKERDKEKGRERGGERPRYRKDGEKMEGSEI